jgi:hypothetical protein
MQEKLNYKQEYSHAHAHIQTYAYIQAHAYIHVYENIIEILYLNAHLKHQLRNYYV